jgi:hypothetical protein
VDCALNSAREELRNINLLAAEAARKVKDLVNLRRNIERDGAAVQEIGKIDLERYLTEPTPEGTPIVTPVSPSKKGKATSPKLKSPVVPISGRRKTKD